MKPTRTCTSEPKEQHGDWLINKTSYDDFIICRKNYLLEWTWTCSSGDRFSYCWTNARTHTLFSTSNPQLPRDDRLSDKYNCHKSLIRFSEFVHQRTAEATRASSFCVGSLAYLGRHAACAGCETSCRADARAAAAPWASAIGDRGLWLLVPLVKLLGFPEAALWLAEGLKWAASARIILITDFRFPSTMSAGRERTVHNARYKNRWTKMIQHTWIYPRQTGK